MTKNGIDVSRFQGVIDWAAVKADGIGFAIIKAGGSENGFFGRWAGYQASVNLQDVRFTKMDEYLGLLPQIVSGITDVLVLCMGIRLAMQGQFTPGMIAQFSVYMKAFLAPANTLISTGQTVQQLRTEMERI